MTKEIIYREIYKGEEERVYRLIADCFSEFVAPGYSEEGIIEFSKYITPKFTEYRLMHDHFILLALDNGMIVGVIEVRNNNHISLFFVKKEYQNKGIGKNLHELAINKCAITIPKVPFVDVHSSPYAVPIYEKLGFAKVSDEQIVKGMRFTPMIFKIV
jgi:GNAT superfamily N-acetyltransferase